MGERSFDDLIDEALAAPMTGWDFSFLRGRSATTPLPWDYGSVVADLADGQPLLDLGTGGGEVLAALPARPGRTVAAEGWAPNVPVAGRRLRPLGIPVIHYLSAPENPGQDLAAGPATAGLPDRLPFRDATFGLVLSRHESFRASEVARVLAPGGHFITQQVDLHDSDDYRAALGLAADPAPDESWLAAARQQVRAAGLAEIRAERAVQQASYSDIGALAWYLLQAVPWIVPEGLAGCRPALHRLHEQMREAPFTARAYRFLLVAQKPG
ncbi:MAG TPA: methyltransferase domain-containing protein [Streptosporangiaceae bacterium]|nr:methyltransferase domain-containing protein [Streptosporangiaceae bacterium]